MAFGSLLLLDFHVYLSPVALESSLKGSIFSMYSK